MKSGHERRAKKHPSKDGTGEYRNGREGGKLRTTPRRKEDSDWMHDPGGKNRFSKLSHVERTAAALSARRQTIRSLHFSLLSSSSSTSSTRAGNSESGATMTTSGSRKGNEYTVPGNLSVSFTARYFRVWPYKQKGDRKLYHVYIARWTSTTIFVHGWGPSPPPANKASSMAFSTDRRVWRHGTKEKRIQAKFPSGELSSRAYPLSSESEVPSPSSLSRFHFCTSIVIVLIVCRTNEFVRWRFLTNCQTGKLPSAWSAQTDGI